MVIFTKYTVIWVFIETYRFLEAIFKASVFCDNIRYIVEANFFFILKFERLFRYISMFVYFRKGIFKGHLGFFSSLYFWKICYETV